VDRRGGAQEPEQQFVIDGEAVLLGIDGISDFNGLHSRRHEEEVQLYAFEYPGAQVDIKLANPGEHQLRELRERRIDLLITRATGQSAAEDLHSEVLFDEPFMFVVGAESEFARGRRVGLSDIIGGKWVLPAPDSAPGTLIDGRLQGRWFSAAEGRRQNNLHRIDNIVDCKRRVCRHSSDLRRKAESEASVLAHSADQICRTAGFRRDRLCEEPYAQPRRGVVHQLRARSRQDLTPQVTAIRANQYHSTPCGHC
jgi:DNA-binding transcriptional LysR family regulator